MTRKLLTIDQVVADHLYNALQLCDGNISEAARALNMHRRTLQRLMRKYRIKVQR